MRTTLSVLALFLTLVFVFPILAFSQKTQKIDKNLENIAGQYAECTAYYELVSHGLNVSDNEETAKSYLDLRDIVMFYSLLLANEGRSKDMGVKVTNSRIEV